MTPEDIPFKPLHEFCNREGFDLYIKDDLTYGIKCKTGWGEAQFGRKVVLILGDYLQQRVGSQQTLDRIIEESRKPSGTRIENCKVENSVAPSFIVK